MCHGGLPLSAMIYRTGYTGAMRGIGPFFLSGLLFGAGGAVSAPGPAPEPATGNGAAPLHIDPLDAGRAAALHRGPDPHARLSAEQQLAVAAQHMAAGRYPQAMAVLTQALSKYPHSARLFAMRADLERRQGDIKSALADLEQAVKLAPDDPLYRVGRAQLYLRFQRVEEALGDLDQAVALAPDLIPARFNRGALLANLGRPRKALADFDHCIAIQPDLPAPWFNRGSMYWSLGEHAKARADIRRFIELAREPRWQEAGRDLLKAWREQEKGTPHGPEGGP